MKTKSKTIFYRMIPSPIGDLMIVANETALIGLFMNAHKYGPVHTSEWQEDKNHSVLNEAERQLAEYFAGTRQVFDLPLQTEGSEFQTRCWEELSKIPFAETWSYGQMAKRVGNSDASRAVGAANGKNPISIIVPCHRVIGASGKLVGFGGGLPRKAALLAFERAVTFGESASEFWMENPVA